MAASFLKGFSVIILVLVAFFPPKLCCLEIDVDPRNYGQDTMQQAHSKREDEDPGRLFLTTRYGKRSRGNLYVKPYFNNEGTTWTDIGEKNLRSIGNSFLELNRVVELLKSDCRLLDTILRKNNNAIAALRNLEEYTKRNQ